MADKISNRELANQELKNQLSFGKNDVSPLPTPVSDIPQMEGSVSEINDAPSVVNNYNVSVNVDGSRGADRVLKETKTLIQKIGTTGVKNSEDLKKNSQTGFLNFGQNINASNVFKNSNFTQTNLSNFLQTKNTNNYNTQTGFNRSSNTNFVLMDNTNPTVSLSSKMGNLIPPNMEQTTILNEVKTAVLGNIVTHRETGSSMPSLIQSNVFPETNLGDNSNVYSENLNIQQQTNQIHDHISNQYSTNTANASSSSAVTNNYQMGDTVNQSSTSNLFSDVKNNNINVIKNTENNLEVTNELTRKSNFEERKTVIENSTEKERTQAFQQRENQIDGIDGMTNPEMAMENFSANKDLYSTPTPKAINGSANRKIKHMNPIPSTISLFTGKMNSPPVWRTVGG